MKPVVIALSIPILLLSLCTVPAQAQMDLTNVVSINPWLWSTAYDYNCSYIQKETYQTLHVYLYSPVNPSFGVAGEERAVTNLGGFECDLSFSEGAVPVSMTFPAGGVNYGTPGSLTVLYDTPLPVVDEPVELATILVYFGGEVGFEVPAEPVPRCIYHPNVFAYVNAPFQATVPGQVSYIDADDDTDPWVGGVCAGEEPDYYFQMVATFPVGQESLTWESLKALYR